MECCGGNAAGLENLMGKPSAPQPPDYVGAAQQTGQSNVTAAIIQRLMGMTGANTPWGSMRWNQTGTQHIGPGGVSVGRMPAGGAPVAPIVGGGLMNAGASADGPPQAERSLNLGSIDPVGRVISGHTGDPLGLYGPPSPIGGTQPSSNAPNSIPGMPDFDIPTFTSTITLSPEQQALFEQQQRNQRQSGAATGQLLSGLDTSPIDYSGMPSLPTGSQLEGTRQKVSDAIYGRASRYLDPQFAQAEEAERTRLANQGFATGTEGFSRALGDFNLAKQRAYADARDAAATQAGAEVSRDYGMGLSSRQQAVSEAMARRQLPLNMISSLQGGGQVGMPQFPGAPGGQGVQGTDYMTALQNQANAALQQYGIQAGQYNSQMGGLYGLGGSALLYAMMSDRRLKKNIRRIADHPLGIGVYSFEYLDGQPAIGVMADEVERVLPAAVGTDARGYKFVRYEMLANSQPNMVS